MAQLVEERHAVALPNIQLNRVFGLRDKLLDEVFAEYIGYTPTGQQFAQLSQRVRRVLGGVRGDVLLMSLRDLVGQEITRDLARTVAWRLAGNISKLRVGKEAGPWVHQAEEEWVPAQIISYSFKRSRWGEAGGLYRLRILAGSACPMILQQWWRSQFVRLLATRLGYSTGRGAFPMRHISELVNLRVWLLLDPKLSQEKPGFYLVRCSSGLLKWNKQIVHMRYRQFDGKPWRCPRDYTHPCCECEVGYLDCPASTHRETVSGYCESEETNGTSIPPERAASGPTRPDVQP